MSPPLKRLKHHNKYTEWFKPLLNYLAIKQSSWDKNISSHYQNAWEFKGQHLNKKMSANLRWHDLNIRLFPDQEICYLDKSDIQMSLSWLPFLIQTTFQNIFGMVAMPFLCRGVWFLPKLSYHRNVSLTVYLPICQFFFLSKSCICINTQQQYSPDRYW